LWLGRCRARKRRAGPLLQGAEDNGGGLTGRHPFAVDHQIKNSAVAGIVVKIAFDKSGAGLIDLLDDLLRRFFVGAALLHDLLQPPFERRGHQDAHGMARICDEMAAAADDNGLPVREQCGKDLEQVLEVFVGGQGGGIEEGLEPILGLAQFSLVEGRHHPVAHMGVLRDEIDQLAVVHRPAGELAQLRRDVVAASAMGARKGHIHPRPDALLLAGSGMQFGHLPGYNPADHHFFPMDWIFMVLKHGSLPMS